MVGDVLGLLNMHVIHGAICIAVWVGYALERSVYMLLRVDMLVIQLLSAGDVLELSIYWQPHASNTLCVYIYIYIYMYYVYIYIHT